MSNKTYENAHVAAENDELVVSNDKQQVIYRTAEEKQDEKTITEDEQKTTIDLNLNQDAIKQETTVVTPPPTPTNDGEKHETTIVQETKIDEQQIMPEIKVEEQQEEIVLNTDVLEKVILENIEKIVSEDLEELEEIMAE